MTMGSTKKGIRRKDGDTDDWESALVKAEYLGDRILETKAQHGGRSKINQVTVNRLVPSSQSYIVVG